MHKRTRSWMTTALVLLSALFMSSFANAQTTPTTPVAPEPEATEAVEEPFDYGAPEITFEQFMGIDLSALPQQRLEDGGFVVGNPDAPVTLIEFSDFACPHCQDYQPVIAAFLIEFVVTGRAKFEYRVVPTAGGAFSYFTGMLLECGEEQRTGAFWDGYHLMWLYAFDGSYSQTDTLAARFANDVGVDFAALRPCVEEHGTAGTEQVAADGVLAASYGIGSTPTLMIRVGEFSPQFITHEGLTYTGGGLPYAALVAAVSADVSPETTPEATEEPN